jgi:predicted transcriptional regulator
MRIDEETNIKLSKLSKRENRSKSNMVSYLITQEYIKQFGRDE